MKDFFRFKEKKLLPSSKAIGKSGCWGLGTGLLGQTWWEKSHRQKLVYARANNAKWQKGMTSWIWQFLNGWVCCCFSLLLFSKEKEFVWYLWIGRLLLRSPSCCYSSKWKQSCKACFPKINYWSKKRLYHWISK